MAKQCLGHRSARAAAARRRPTSTSDRPASSPQGHPAGAVNVPLLEPDERDRADAAESGFRPRDAGRTFAPDTPLLVGCQVGGRSMRAAQMLESFGFTERRQRARAASAARAIRSGASIDPGWAESGLPVEARAAPAGERIDDLLAQSRRADRDRAASSTPGSAGSRRSTPTASSGRSSGDSTGSAAIRQADPPRSSVHDWAARTMARHRRVLPRRRRPTTSSCDGDVLHVPERARDAASGQQPVRVARLPRATHKPRPAAARRRRAAAVERRSEQGHVGLCQLFARFGMTALRLSLPYHDERRPRRARARRLHRQLEHRAHAAGQSAGRARRQTRPSTGSSRRATSGSASWARAWLVPRRC